jgi:copper oxidase (laccase) domain-containing protein
MTAQFESEPSNLLAAIGPSIGPCCYQVGTETYEAFAQGPLGGRRKGWFIRDGDRWRLDLWMANHDQLVAAGLRSAAIHLSRECTACSLDRYFSFRKEGEQAGRLLAAIRPRAARRTLS